MHGGDTVQIEKAERKTRQKRQEQEKTTTRQDAR
jgi:hypothetical protein